MGCCGSKRKRVKDSRDEQTSQSRSKSTDRSRSPNPPASPGGCKVALKQSMHPKTSAPVDRPSAPSLPSASSDQMKPSQATASDQVVQVSSHQVAISQPSVEEAKLSSHPMPVTQAPTEVSVLPVPAGHTPVEPAKVSTLSVPATQAPREVSVLPVPADQTQTEPAKVSSLPVPSTQAPTEVSVLPVPATQTPVEPAKVFTLPVPTQAPMEQAKTSALPVPSTQTPVEQTKASTSAPTSSQLPSPASQHQTSLLLPSPQSNAPPASISTVNKSASMSSLSPSARKSVPFTATPLRQRSSSQGRLPFSEAYKPISLPFASATAAGSSSSVAVDSTQQKASAGVPNNTEQHSDGSKLSSGSASQSGATVSLNGPTSQTASAQLNSAPTLPTGGALPAPLKVRPGLTSSLPTGGQSRPSGGGLLLPPTTGGFGKFHFSGNQLPTPGAFPPPTPQPQIGSLPNRTGSGTSLASQRSQAKPGILPPGSGSGTLPTPAGALPQPRGALPIGGTSGSTHSATLPQPVQVSATPLAVKAGASDASNQLQPIAGKQNDNHKSTN